MRYQWNCPNQLLILRIIYNAILLKEFHIACSHTNNGVFSTSYTHQNLHSQFLPPCSSRLQRKCFLTFRENSGSMLSDLEPWALTVPFNKKKLSDISILTIQNSIYVWMRLYITETSTNLYPLQLLIVAIMPSQELPLKNIGKVHIIQKRNLVPTAICLSWLVFFRRDIWPWGRGWQKRTQTGPFYRQSFKPTKFLHFASIK